MKIHTTSKPIFLCFFLFFTTLIYAQNFKLGLRGGFSIASLSDRKNNIYSENFSSRSVFEGGILAEFSISKSFSIQPELTYTQRGGERDGLQPIPPDDIPPQLAAFLPAGVIPYASFDNVSKLNYLEIPILLKYSWGETWRFYANAGPYVGFLIKAEQVTSGFSAIFLDPFGQTTVPNPTDPTNPLIVPFNAETDIKDKLEKFNIGVQGGIGIARKLNDRNELFFDVRVSSGFIPIQKDETFGESTVGGFVFSLGYAYSFGE